jgi:hypothetical protein
MNAMIANAGPEWRKWSTTTLRAGIASCRAIARHTSTTLSMTKIAPSANDRIVSRSNCGAAALWPTTNPGSDAAKAATA